ncbi:MAG TPA: TRL-like protein family [Crenotrichaceae bacterium]|nr:TRL-like protein family [Crenotrichaceae bacterium]
MLKVKTTVMVGVMVGAALLTGCATNQPIGAVYTDLALPVQATDEHGSYSKVGRSTCISYVAMVAQGDCSVNAAKRDGGITSVHHMDWRVHSLLGIISRYELSVYGD